MQDNLISKINPIYIALGAFQIVFIIFVIITLSNLFSSGPEVAIIGISNYSTIANLADFPMNDVNKSVIEGNLNHAVALNHTGNIQDYGAKIREDSIHSLYDKDRDIHYLSAIIDLENFKQSYRLVYRYANTYPNIYVPSDYPAMIFCPSQQELIYGDFDCKDDWPDNVADQILFNMLNNKIFNNFTVGTNESVYNGEPLTLYINTATDDSSTTSSAVSELSDYLSSLGYNIDNYTYAIVHNCCSENAEVTILNNPHS